MNIATAILEMCQVVLLFSNLLYSLNLWHNESKTLDAKEQTY